MGNRRMFSKEIVRSDAFLDLPLSSQALYFQLGMETDDRGYISNGKAIIRLIGANKGDLELLIQKRFILLRGETLLLQKHFKMNNYIQKDRFHETNYTDDLNKLFYDKNGAYTERKTDDKVLKLDCIQDVSEMDTEVKLSKYKLSKYKLSKDKLSKVNKIELDITRYKHSAECEKIINSLIEIGYIENGDLFIQDYASYLDNLFEEYGTRDVRVKVDYFVSQVTKPKVINEKLIHELDKEKLSNIENRFAYFKSSLDNGFRRINDYE